MRTTEVDRGGHSFEGLSISLWSSLFFHMTVLIDRVPLFFLYQILVFMYIFFFILLIVCWALRMLLIMTYNDVASTLAKTVLIHMIHRVCKTRLIIKIFHFTQVLNSLIYSQAVQCGCDKI